MQNPEEMSSNGLHDLVKSSYKRNNEAEQLGARHGYVLDHKLSNSEHKVFVDPDRQSSTVVFTGSRKAGDWLVTDPAIALGLGKYTKRYKDSENVMKQVKEKYNGPTTTVGHSLGGWLGENVKADKKYTVNKATGLGDVGKTIRSNQTDIVVDKDPVSVLSATQKYKGNLIKVQNKNYNPLVSHDYKHITKINI